MRAFKFILAFIQLLFLSSLFAAEPLSDGYKDIKLGMSQAAVKDILSKTPDFIFKKEEVLSIRIDPDTEIISTEGNGFLLMAYFHFSEDKLFQIYLKISQKNIGYYKLLKKFYAKFGTPNKFEPKRAQWENEKVRIVLEKPCVLKYVYLPVWNELVKSDQKTIDAINIARDQFVDGL